MKKNMLKVIKKLFYLIIFGFLLYLIKNGLNIHLLTKLTVSSDESFDVQINLNLERLSSFNQLNNNLNIINENEISLNTNSSVCKFIPDHLVGQLKLDNTALTENELESKFRNVFPNVKGGGHWQPIECKSRFKVAIIVPYRNREFHLRLFLNYMHPFLQKQRLDYRIYIIEEVNK